MNLFFAPHPYAKSVPTLGVHNLDSEGNYILNSEVPPYQELLLTSETLAQFERPQGADVQPKVAWGSYLGLLHLLGSKLERHFRVSIHPTYLWANPLTSKGTELARDKLQTFLAKFGTQHPRINDFEISVKGNDLNQLDLRFNNEELRERLLREFWSCCRDRGTNVDQLLTLYYLEPCYVPSSGELV